MGTFLVGTLNTLGWGTFAIFDKNRQ